MTYGCKNQPRPTPATEYPGQKGWFYDASGMTRKPHIVQIKHTMTTECQYSKNTIDVACTGCEHNAGSQRPPDSVTVPEDDALFRNHYRHCGVEWTDDWSCMCNDRCPECNAEIEPYHSDDKPQPQEIPR